MPSFGTEDLDEALWGAAPTPAQLAAARARGEEAVAVARTEVSADALTVAQAAERLGVEAGELVKSRRRRAPIGR